MVSTDIKGENWVKMCSSMDQFGLKPVVSDSLCYIFIYMYIHGYNTILVNKVEGFHITDRGTELKSLCSPKHAK